MKNLICEYANDCEIDGYCEHRELHENNGCRCAFIPCGLIGNKIGREIFCIDCFDDGKILAEIERILDI